MVIYGRQESLFVMNCLGHVDDFVKRIAEGMKRSSLPRSKT